MCQACLRTLFRRRNRHNRIATLVPFPCPVGLSGLEPLTPALSAQCSNRLSYRPQFCEPPAQYDQHSAVRSTSAIVPSGLHQNEDSQRHINR